MNINLNTQVKFVMTQDAHEVYQKWIDNLNVKINIPKVNEVITMPLWEVMQIFGSSLFMGATKQIFQNNELDFLLENVAQVY